MSIYEMLIAELEDKGFAPTVPVRDSWPKMYYIQNENVGRMVMIFYSPSGYEIPGEIYPQIIESVKKQLQDAGVQEIELLSIVFTRAPERSRKYCIDQDNHWIIDLNSRCLLIYENQKDEFMGLAGFIRGLLGDERISTDMYSAVGQIHKPAKKRRRHQGKWMTPCNVSLVIINVIIYLIVWHTNFWGETPSVLRRGSISWEGVVSNRQYYRLVTAMFLHGDFSHLFGNMLIQLFIGSKLEKIAGKINFIAIYFGSGILAGITSIGYNRINYEDAFAIGASGAVFGLIGALLYILIANKGRMEDLSTAQLMMFIILSLYTGLSNTTVDLAAHIGGFVAGFIMAVPFYQRYREGN